MMATNEATVARIERALVTVAYIVLRYGEQYAPILERLERELAVARRPSVANRARLILAAKSKLTGESR